jgi:hypothetical protein
MPAAIFIRARRCAPPRFFGATGLSQQEVFKDELAFASEKGSATREARHFSQCRLDTRFDFDDLIQRLAIRARKECTRPAASHVTPPNISALIC